MSTSSAESANLIQRFAKQQSQQGACVGKLIGEKGYTSVKPGSRYHFIIGLVIDLGEKTVQMEITTGHHYQALAPLHQYVLDALRFETGKGPAFSYEDMDAVMLHAKLAADVIDTLLSLQQAMASIRR